MAWKSALQLLEDDAQTRYLFAWANKASSPASRCTCWLSMGQVGGWVDGWCTLTNSMSLKRNLITAISQKSAIAKPMIQEVSVRWSRYECILC